MGEEKTLQELNEEYVKLVEDVNELKTRVETAEENKNNANIQLEKALDALVDSEEDYKMKKSVYENAKGVYSEEIVEKMKEAMIEAETNVASLKKTLELRKENLKKAENAFGIIQEDAKNKNDRMNLILVSFGANEDINKAIVNELDNDYGDKVEEKEQAQKAIDELKTKINDDSKIQENVEELGRLLEEKEKAILEYSKDNSDANLKKINELHAQIKKKRQTISRRMRTLGIKGGKIEATEIEAMVTNRDENGRMIIPVLDRQYVDLDKEIGSLLNEKSEIIKSMNISREMAKDPSKVSKEYQELLNEIETLTKEVENAEKQKQESEEKLASIPEERRQLEAELAEAEKNVDKEAIKALEDEIKQIQAEKVEKVENPRKKEIKEEIEKLKAQKIQAESGENIEDNIDYKNAKLGLENAQKRLENEKIHPTLSRIKMPDFLGGTITEDEIIENPELVTINEELKNKEDELESIYEKLEGNEDLKELSEKVDLADKDKEKILKELEKAVEEKEELEAESKEKYVGKETYKSLEGDDVKKLFNMYRASELALRQAMFELQTKPSDETIKKFLITKQAFEKATKDLQKELFLESGVEPTPKAIHSYLEGILRKESKDPDIEMDEAYNSRNMENKLEMLMNNRKISKESEELEDFENSSNKLNRALKAILSGTVIDDNRIKSIAKGHIENLENFENLDAVKKILEGENSLIEKTGRFAFFRKLFSPKYVNEVEYDFEPNKKPEIVEQYKVKSDKVDELKELNNAKVKEYEDAKEAYEIARFMLLSNEEQDKVCKLEEKIEQLKAKKSNVPEKINKTLLEELEKEVQKAQAKVDKIKEDANIDKTPEEIQKAIETLEEEDKETPEEVDDFRKSADKERRIREKEEKIKALKGGESDKIKTIKDKLADLLNIETSEKAKLGKAEETLEKKGPILNDKKRRMSVLSLAKEKFGAIKNLIRIKDASKLSDRRSGNLAQDLVEATKNQRMEDEER